MICANTGLPPNQACGNCVPCLLHVLYERDSELATLREANRELEKDRERLDWLGANPLHEIEAIDEHESEWVWINHNGVEPITRRGFSSHREAIDAAMAEGGEG